MNKKINGKESKKLKNNVIKKKRTVNSKILFIASCMTLLFFVIIFKIIFLNVVDGEELTRRALNQLTRTETISADRGIIYDRNKKELAINVTKANVFYNMGGFDEKKAKAKADFKEMVREQTTEDARAIAKVLGISEDDILSQMKGKRVVKIASNVPREKALKLQDLNLVRVSVDDVTKRFYPYNSLAAHVIGFANDENTGVYGVESSYDKELSGMAGKSVLLKNNSHKQIPLTDEETFAPQEGYSLVLTVDENIQQIADDVAKKTRELNDAEKVGIIVQDTKTGEILAMANNESYDLNNPKAPVDDAQSEEWDKLSKEEKTDLWFKNWTNFCVNEQYEPGSTFKLITSAAAFEEATTNLTKTYNCPGVYTEIPGVKIGCTSPTRGEKTVQKALEESCNITLIKMGRELGPEKLLKYVKAFGFGQPTGIDLPAEAKGQIPESASDIQAARLATMSYGHGIAVTPIQLITAVSAVVNKGYLNTPRVVLRMEDKNGNVIEKEKTVTKRKVISDKTSQTMRMLMEKVVSEGTGKKAQVPGYKIGGKTGTANIATEKGYENAYIASFIGVAPIDDPRITVLVVVKRPRGSIFGSTVAAPAAQEVMAKSLEYLKVPKTEKVDEDTKEEMVSVPNVRNLLLSDAGKAIVDRGLKFNTNEEDLSNYAVVTKQNPAPGISVKKGTIVDLEINNNKGENKIMPILIGKKEKEAKAILKGLKLEYNINGNGKVVSQKPESGSIIKAEDDSVVILTMESELNEDNDLNAKSDDNDISDKNSKENNDSEQSGRKTKSSKSKRSSENNDDNKHSGKIED